MSPFAARGPRLCLACLLLTMIGAPQLLAQTRFQHGQLVRSYTAGQRRGGPLPSNPRGQAALNLLSYFGGPVMPNVQVVAVFWTSAVDPGEQTNATGFYAAVTNSPWMDLLAQYSTVGVSPIVGFSGSNQTIGRGSFLSAVTIMPTNTSTNLSDADIQTELASQISSGALPAPQLDAGGNPNTLYMTYFPPGYSITDPNGDQSCVAGGFCAYHGTMLFGPNSELVPYGVIPDQSPGSGCSTGCGSDPNYINNLDSVCSHELAESVTDTAVGAATSFGPPLAWYDPNQNDPGGGGEIGDICNAQQSSITVGGQTYTVQLLWSNRDGACAAFTPGFAMTSITLVSSSSPQAKFRLLRLTAAVTVTSTLAPVTQGSVVFSDSGVSFATVAVNASGTAIYNGGLSVGRHLITASFAGTSALAPSTSTPILTQYQSPKPR